jgi:signal transduction histidine kinase
MSAIEPDQAVGLIARIASVPTILDVVCRTTGMGFAAVAHVTEGRWIACSVRDTLSFGLQPGGELKVETTICHEIREHRDPVVINNVAGHPIYSGHPTPVLYGFQSYISFPIVLPDGSFFGTLCAIDPAPRPLDTPETLGTFRMFAELIAFHIDAHQRLAASEASLVRERQLAELREQFIAVLGHDLRNPLAAIAAAANLIERHPQRAAQLLPQIGQSVARMAALIDNVLDLARFRLGGGIALKRDPISPLAPTLSHVIAELCSTNPTRTIEVELALTEPVAADHARIAQLLSNLLGNALTHGDPAAPVRVAAHSADGVFTLAVANAGAPIPPETQANLFEPFFRGPNPETPLGLGLGLYIAAQIARAHGGRIDVSSSAAETRFTFRMQARPASLPPSSQAEDPAGEKGGSAPGLAVNPNPAPPSE